MFESIDTHLFCEIIQSEGVILIGHEVLDDEVIEYYHGPSGRRIPICVSDEFIGGATACQLLVWLGLRSIAKTMFVEALEAIESESSNE